MARTPRKAPAKKAPRPRRAAWHQLVAPRALAPRLDDPDLVVLDCRFSLQDADHGARAWKEGHVPGAVFVDVERELTGPKTPRTGRHPVPDVDAFRESCSRWGVEDGVQVVVYDDKGGIFASRAWWLLRDYGHLEVAVLDGGFPAWVEEGLPVSTGPAKERPRTRFDGRPGHMPAVTAWEMTTRAPRRLVDARAPERYRGDVEPIDPVAGHIPGATNVPTSANLDERGRFLPPDELRNRYERVLGDLPAREAAVYCGSGITATHDILAMEVAGLFGAKLYPGSWSEWIRDKLRPVSRGDEGGSG